MMSKVNIHLMKERIHSKVRINKNKLTAIVEVNSEKSQNDSDRNN
jgi:hypothetical protein